MLTLFYIQFCTIDRTQLWAWRLWSNNFLGLCTRCKTTGENCTWSRAIKVVMKNVSQMVAQKKWKLDFGFNMMWKVILYTIKIDKINWQTFAPKNIHFFVSHSNCTEWKWTTALARFPFRIYKSEWANYCARVSTPLIKKMVFRKDTILNGIILLIRNLIESKTCTHTIKF